MGRAQQKIKTRNQRNSHNRNGQLVGPAIHVARQGIVLPDLEVNIICRIFDFVAGSPHDLAQFECALSSGIRTECLADSFQSAHFERWARLIAAEADLCLKLPPDMLSSESVTVRAGALVRISGLKSKTELNGQLALVHHRDSDTGRWACRLLRNEQLISCKPDNLWLVQGLLPMSVLKKALCTCGISTGLHGGWRGLTSAQFVHGIHLLERFHMEKPDGRIVKLDHQKIVEKARHNRLLFAHFDVVFDDGSIAPLVESFRRDDLNAIGVAHSRPVVVEIDGEKADFTLKFRAKEEWGFSIDEVALNQPHVGLECGLDFDNFKLKAKGGDDDMLMVSCALMSPSSEHQYISHTLEKFESTGYAEELRQWNGFYRPSRCRQFFVFDPTANGHHHVSTLVLHTGSVDEGNAAVWSEPSWKSKHAAMEGSYMIRTATWNRNLLGTDKVPIIHPEQNDQALDPFPQNFFHGAIALLRRGGGNGFVQKTATAKAAGAVGCIVFDGDGPLGPWFSQPGCSLVFNDIQYPDPGIPMLLVDKEVGMRLSAAARLDRGARVQILVDNSREALTKLPPEFDEFINKAITGEPVRLAVLVERFRSRNRSFSLASMERDHA